MHPHKNSGGGLFRLRRIQCGAKRFDMHTEMLSDECLWIGLNKVLGLGDRLNTQCARSSQPAATKAGRRQARLGPFAYKGRSNSARAAIIWNMNMPVGESVSIDSFNEAKWMPRSRRLLIKMTS